MQACEWIGAAQGGSGAPSAPCADCEHRCVLNRELASIKGEVFGQTLANTPTHLAAALCPALTVLLRFRGAPPPPRASLVRDSARLL